ncbi:alpha-L-fucosidase [Pedobacter sp. MW01-1-1]|uniref:alpha-L-fucosidase n=1 Tax=Pedobacter sp. MW01-1-1 TaxID=3383027 RepID=UPI003FF07749
MHILNTLIRILTRSKTCIILLFLFIGIGKSIAQQTENKPDREEWFRSLGLGMFIHWSFDSQVGAVISHSMVGASPDYLKKFVYELPKTFDPDKMNPKEWAVLAKLAGMKYVVFTAKHHSGFAMWNTKTTDFSIKNTPFKRDITKEIFEAFREQGIAIGVYFSPEDFHLLYQMNVPIGRLQHPMHYPANNSKLMALDKSQLKELLSNYGKIDVIFFDGPADGLKEYAWKLQPDIVVTRGQMKTPEQTLPKEILNVPWEACFTMGTDWQYKPTNDPHKSGTQIINMLIETRAKGGNLLLNVGPKPNGEIQIEQEALLREMALWNLVNEESIRDVRPWHFMKQDDIWFTENKKNNTIYAFIPGGPNWKYGTRKNLVLKNLKQTAATKISVVGYNSQVVEYRKDFDASIRAENTDSGIQISAVNGLRLYTNNQWPNPIVLKIENATYTGPITENKTKDKKESNGVEGLF